MINFIKMVIAIMVLTFNGNGECTCCHISCYILGTVDYHMYIVWSDIKHRSRIFAF